MLLTGDIEPYQELFLDLEYQVSEPYTRFVFSSPEQARTVRQLLFDRHLCEFSPPFGQVLLDDGQAIGMVACLSSENCNRCRLRTALTLSKSGLFQHDLALATRLQLANQTLLKCQKDDFYLSRLAVHETSRGKGVSHFLMRYVEEEARRHGCRRLVLEVHPANTLARTLYQRQRFEELALHQVTDSESGRSLEYLHMAKILA